MGVYSDRFWKKNWDEGIDDLKPEEYDTTYVNMIEESFKKFADKLAFDYLGVGKTFGELDEYANQFANMLLEQGFKKGDVVGINLPNTPQYLIALIGTLRAGCIISGVSPLLSAEQIKYQINDLTSTGKKSRPGNPGRYICSSPDQNSRRRAKPGSGHCYQSGQLLTQDQASAGKTAEKGSLR